MATSKNKTANAPSEIVELYDKMVASCPEVLRKGATMPNTAVNGHMFSFVHTTGAVALRLPASAREEFINKYGTKLYDAYGVIQKEYVLVPESLLRNTEELAPYFAMSNEYTKTLKPKKSVA